MDTIVSLCWRLVAHSSRYLAPRLAAGCRRRKLYLYAKKKPPIQSLFGVYILRAVAFCFPLFRLILRARFQVTFLRLTPFCDLESKVLPLRGPAVISMQRLPLKTVTQSIWSVRWDESVCTRKILFNSNANARLTQPSHTPKLPKPKLVINPNTPSTLHASRFTLSLPFSHPPTPQTS